ncbi:MAG: MOSC domain-containing protein [Chloroflexota bacterium]|nr:MOSC domain-containing protein [Chloroflexota bacterium]
MPVVSKLAIAPVKGLALVHPTEVVLGLHGVAHNRRFFLVAADGRHRSGLAFGPLAAVVPDYDPASERLVLRFPDGRIVDGDGSAVDGEIHVPWGAARVIHAHVVDGPFAEALSEYVGTDLRLVRTNDDAHPQSYPASIVSEASLDELERSADLPEPLDGRRFRMLVTLAGCEAFEEDRWVGGEVRMGQAVVRVAVPTARCATTTRDPATGQRDWDALRALKDLRGVSPEQTVDLGVYAAVVSPGRIAVGDAVTPA